MPLSSSVLLCESKPLKAYLFGEETCLACSRTREFLGQVLPAYGSTVVIEYFEVSHNQSARLLLLDFCKVFNISEARLPALFTGTTFLNGEEEIREKLMSTLDFYLNRTGDYEDTWALVIRVKDQARSELTIKTLVVSALVDSVNPCALSAMIFLLSLVSALASTSAALMAGVTFCLGVYVTYFALGIGIVSATTYAGLGSTFHFVAGMLAAVVGLLNLVDFIRGGESILDQACHQSDRFRSLARRGSPMAGLLLGMFVALLELPCSGVAYIAVLSMLSAPEFATTGIILLVLYNLIFVGPLAIILLAFSVGTKIDKIPIWKKEVRCATRLVTGLLLILMALILLLGWA